MRASQGGDKGSGSGIDDNNNNEKGQECIKADSMYTIVCEKHR